MQQSCRLLAISHWLLAPGTIKTLHYKHYTIMNTNDVCSPLPHRADARGASVATTAGLSAPRSLACEPWGGSPSSLTKSELAQLYFPGAPRSSALRLLHKYITSAHGLLPALEQVGYQRTSRRLTRRQVQLIFEYLGEP